MSGRRKSSAVGIKSTTEEFALTHRFAPNPDLVTGTLENGIEYVLIPHDNPSGVVCLRLVVSVCDSDKLFRNRLVAAFALETLLRSGEENSLQAPSNVDEIASVSSVELVFNMTVPVEENSTTGFNQLSSATSIFSGITSELVFDEEALARAKKSVLASLDTTEALKTSLFWTGTEFEENFGSAAAAIESVSVAQLQEYYVEAFHPKNLQYFASGDFKESGIVCDILRRHFGSIKSTKPVKHSTRGRSIDLPVATQFVSFSSQDSRESRVGLVFRTKNEEIGKTMKGVVDSTADEMVGTIILSRLTAIQIASQGEIESVGVEYHTEGKIESRFAWIRCKPGAERKFLEKVLVEMARLAKYGISDSTFEAYKEMILRLALLGSSADAASSDRYLDLVAGSVKHSVVNQTITDALQAFAQAPNRINLQAFNAHLGKQALNLTNGTVLLASPDEAAVAGFTELATSILSSIAGRELEPKSDFTGEGVSILPAGILPPIGKILHEEDQGGATAIAFENGVECIVSDEETQSGLPPGASLGCVLVMERDGGLAEVYHRNPDKFESAYVAGHLARGALLNNLSSLSIIFHETSIALFSIGAHVSCSAPSFEALLQVLHLLFTGQLRFNRNACKQYIALLKRELAAARTPEDAFDDAVKSLNWQTHPLLKEFTEADLDNVDLDFVEEYFKKTFSNPAEFNFTIIVEKQLGGNVSELLAKYLGSIPVEMSKEQVAEAASDRLTETFIYLAPKIKFRPGITIEDSFASVESSTLAISFPLPNVANLLELTAVEVVCLILEAHLFELLRNTAGTIYTVTVAPKYRFSVFFPGELNVVFTCEPSICNQLVESCLIAIKKIQDEGPSKKQLQSAFRILGSGMEPPASAHKLPTDATTLFGADIYTTDISDALTPELAQDLLKFMLPLQNYTAVKRFPAALKGLTALTHITKPMVSVAAAKESKSAHKASAVTHTPKPSNTSSIPVVLAALAVITGIGVGMFIVMKSRQKSPK